MRLSRRLVLASIGVALPVAAAMAQSASPYDMTYTARSDAALRAAPEAGSAAKGEVKRGTTGIVLRWCRPEIPFGTWQFGRRVTWRKLLDERVCEVSAGGQVGFVDGTVLDPVP